MTSYNKYTTTVVGSYSVPRWYESLEKQVEDGILSKADMADAQFRATQAAILDQEMAGIDSKWANSWDRIFISFFDATPSFHNIPNWRSYSNF
ncbi:MAG: hypothetical protein JRE65_02570 [Deltaproteobacteria bacterium]|jgi:methionine synthase II (cobalamin-independent)|nr:hypothetical protein [Deltaproteobacteria bacterium]